MIFLAELFGVGSAQSCANLLHDIETQKEVKHQIWHLQGHAL
jgi:hypothetical protein